MCVRVFVSLFSISFWASDRDWVYINWQKVIILSFSMLLSSLFAARCPLPHSNLDAFATLALMCIYMLFFFSLLVWHWLCFFLVDIVMLRSYYVCIRLCVCICVVYVYSFSSVYIFLHNLFFFANAPALSLAVGLALCVYVCVWNVLWMVLSLLLLPPLLCAEHLFV